MRANWTALPIVFFAAMLIAGDCVGFMLSGFAGLWAWGAAFVVLSASATIGWKIRYAVYFTAFAAGVTLAWRVESKRIALDECSKMIADAGRPPVFVMRVEGEAVSRRNKKGRRIVSFGSTLSGVPVKVVARFPDDIRLPADGERWRCAGWLSERKNSANRFAGRTLWVMDSQCIERTAGNDGLSADVTYRRLSDSLIRRVGKGVEWSREFQSFSGAMLLGRKDGIPYRRLAVFAAAGTIHVFAISGLHVMLIAGLLNFLLRALGLSRKMCSACVIPMLAGYVMLIGAPPSAVRAGLMVSLYSAAYLFGRKPDSLAAWGVAACVIFAVSPEMVLNVGCVLSFSVMLGIVLWIRWSGQFASPWDGLLRLAAIESMLECRKRKRIILWIYRRLKWFSGSLGISFAAWIAGAPVAAVVFGRLALGSLLVNVAIVPLAGIAVTFAVFGMLAAFVLPQIGILFNNLAAMSIYLMSWLSEMVVEIPYSSVETMPWSWLDCLMWYTSWFALFGLLARYLPRREFIHVREWEKGDD